MINTLLEFITFTKGTEYLIAIAFLMVFVTLWQLVNASGARAMLRTMPLNILAVGILILVAGYVGSVNEANSTAATATPPPQNGLEVRTSAYLANTYGPANHFHQEMSTRVGCATCHHHSGNEIHPCKDCHGVPFNPENLNKPGLKAAYHERCQDCHQDAFSGPESCIKCHQREEEAPSKLLRAG